MSAIAQTPESLIVSCLRCGAVRRSGISDTGHLVEAECPSCQYLGWCEAEAAHPQAITVPEVASAWL